MRNSSPWKSCATLLLLLGFAVSSVFAQQRTVTGTVTSEELGALPGVNIVIQGTTSGAVTDTDGNYSLSVPGPDAVLVYSFIGYTTVAVTVGDQTNISPLLVSDVTALDEIVVTGYTTQRKADITGAVSIVNVEELNQVTSASIVQKLDGRASGVVVNSGGQPGGRNTVRIRGISSFTNNDPLYIVDGVPIEGAYFNWLNPNDVESLQVLKDPSTASIYGSRANNGVIIITTKKGKQATKAKLSVDVNLGIQTPISGMDKYLIQDPMDYFEIVNRSHVNANLDTPTNIYGDPNSPSIPNYIWPNDGVNQTQTVDESTYSYYDNLIMPSSQGTDWWDELFDPALVQDYNIRMSGGGANSVYNISMNYYNQDGTMKYNSMDRFSIRANTEFKFGRLAIGENFVISREHNVGGIGNQGEGSTIGQVIKMQPVVPVYDIDGYFAGAKANTLGNGSNPVGQAYKRKDNAGTYTRMVGNVYSTLDIVDGLQFKTSLGLNMGSSLSKGFNFPTPENSEPTMVWSLDEDYRTDFEWTWTNTLVYNKSFGNHNLNILAGYEAIEFNSNGLDGFMAGYVTTVQSAWYIQDALGDPSTKNVTSEGATASLTSLFGKIDYNFARKYYLSATVRRDGSSKFGSNNRYGTFPAFSAGWRMSDEGFMSGAAWLDDLRLRAGYGITGNQAIPNGRTANQYGGDTQSTFYDINGTNTSIVTGYRLTALGNPDLKWEENVAMNIGLDLSMIDRRLTFVIDVYQRTVDDLLFDPALPATAGHANPPMVNIGTMENKGVDFSIGYRSAGSGDFNWDIELIGSQYSNEIVKIDGVTDFFYGPTTGRGGTTVTNQLYYPIGSFYGYETNGIFQNDGEVDAHAQQDGKEVGRFRFVDQLTIDTDGDGVADEADGIVNSEDRTIIGSPHPDFTAGISFNANWKNFDMNMFFFGSYGNDIFDITKEFTVFRLFSTNVRQDRLTDSWEPNNTGAQYPQLDQNDQYSSAYSDFYVEDASYLRFKNFQIGYTVPKAGWFSSMRVYIQGQNLFTLTNYSGYDPALPAISSYGAAGERSDQSMGLDRGTYPASKIFSIGVNATF